MNMNQIHVTLPGYAIQMAESGVEHSRRKLEAAHQTLAPFVHDHRNISLLPCLSEDETLAYRCSCSFQLLQQQYAMRQDHSPVLIADKAFPIANKRVQQVMTDFYDFFNNPVDGTLPLHLAASLSSVTFVSSWSEHLDCVIKMNYSSPLPLTIANTHAFKLEAEALLTKTNVNTLVLCSRQSSMIVGNPQPCIRDILRLSFQISNKSHNNEFHHYILSDITLTLEHQFHHHFQDSFTTSSQSQNMIYSRYIYYQKKFDAFLHPNANAMKNALLWILQRLNCIVSNYRYNSTLLNNTNTTTNPLSLSLLEMYCGCGAHTMAISKIALFDRIVAVERDARLVQACRQNAILNQCAHKQNTVDDIDDDDPYRYSSPPHLHLEQKQHGYRHATQTPTKVQVVQGCAGDWAKKYTKATQESNRNDTENYQVLLVDPPRSGLDCHVRNMIKMGPFEHVLYISCGIQALQRDLEDLTEFQVVHTLVLDLFPRTDSVETLIHLQKKSSSVSLCNI